MHPQLIPERHPMCGKYMEELVRCREANPVRRYFGECNDVTYKLTRCLNEEKAVMRAPRQAKFKEEWAAKREADAARMRKLEEEAAARAAAKAEAAAQDAQNASSSTGSSATSAAGSSSQGPPVQAASVAEGPVGTASHESLSTCSPVMSWCKAALHGCSAIAPAAQHAAGSTAPSSSSESCSIPHARPPTAPTQPSPSPAHLASLIHSQPQHVSQESTASHAECRHRGAADKAS